jgi:hypothetical protein
MQVKAELVDQVESHERPPEAHAAPDHDVAVAALPELVDLFERVTSGDGGRSFAGLEHTWQVWVELGNDLTDSGGPDLPVALTGSGLRVSACVDVSGGYERPTAGVRRTGRKAVDRRRGAKALQCARWTGQHDGPRPTQIQQSERPRAHPSPPG